MSELLRKFRTQFPDDTRSDHEITGSLGRKYESKGINPSDVDADFGAAFEEIKKRGTITLGTEAKRGFKRGVAQTISTGFGGGALIADAVGADGVKEWAMEGYDKQQAIAAKNPATIQSYKEVDDFSDAVRFATGLGGEVAPTAVEALVTGVATGGVGYVAGKAVAKNRIKKMISKELLGAAGGKVAKETRAKSVDVLVKRAATKAARRGTAAGVTTSSVWQNAGETYGDLYDTAATRGDRIAASLMAGTIAGALDAAVPLVVLKRMFPAKVASELTDKVIKKTALDTLRENLDNAFQGYSPLKRKFFTTLAKDTSNEAWTEVAQEMVQEGARKYADPDYVFDPDQFRERLINSAIAGAVGGAQFGAFGAAGATNSQAKFNKNLKNAAAFYNEITPEGEYDTGEIVKGYNLAIEGEKLDKDLEGVDSMPIFNGDGSFNFPEESGFNQTSALDDLVAYVQSTEQDTSNQGAGAVVALVSYTDAEGQQVKAKVRGESLEGIKAFNEKLGATNVSVYQINDPVVASVADESPGAPRQKVTKKPPTASERTRAEAALNKSGIPLTEEEHAAAVEGHVDEERERLGEALPDEDGTSDIPPTAEETEEALDEFIDEVNANETLTDEKKKEVIAKVKQQARKAESDAKLAEQKAENEKKIDDVGQEGRDAAQAIIDEGAAIPANPVNRETFKGLSQKAFNLDDEQADTYFTLIEAFAQSWGDNNNSTADEFYTKFFSEVRSAEQLQDGLHQAAAAHVSPYEFDRFAEEFMGKGEGNQSFGWGFYFSNDEDVVDGYHRQFTDDNGQSHQYNVTLWPDKDENLIDLGESLDELTSDHATAIATQAAKGGLGVIRDSRFIFNSGLSFTLEGTQSWKSFNRLFAEAGHGTVFTRENDIGQANNRLVSKLALSAGIDGIRFTAAPSRGAAMRYQPTSRKSTAVGPKEIKRLQALWAYVAGGDGDVRIDADDLDITSIAAGKDGNLVVTFLDETPQEYSAEELFDKIYELAGLDEDTRDTELEAFERIASAVKLLDGGALKPKRGTYNFVVFSDTDVQVDDGPLTETLKQADKIQNPDDLSTDPTVKGTFRLLGGRAVIEGRKGKADISTGLHEFSHVIRETPGILSTEQHQVVYDWLGVAGEKEMTTDGREKFARAFEVYLRNGHAPTPELSSVFAKLSKWMTTIYESIKGSPLEGSNLTPELVKVFDSLLTPKDAEAKAVGALAESSNVTIGTLDGKTFDPMSMNRDYVFYSKESIEENSILADTPKERLEKSYGHGRSSYTHTGAGNKGKKVTRRAVALLDPDTGEVEIRGVYNNGASAIFIHKENGDKNGENLNTALKAGKVVLGLIAFPGVDVQLTDKEKAYLAGISADAKEIQANEKLTPKKKVAELKKLYTQGVKRQISRLMEKKGGFKSIYYKMPAETFESLTSGEREGDIRDSARERMESGAVMTFRVGEGAENMLQFATRDDDSIDIDEDSGDGLGEIADVSNDDEVENSEVYEGDLMVVDDEGVESAADTSELFSDEPGVETKGLKKLRLELEETHAALGQYGLNTEELRTILDSLDGDTPATIAQIEEALEELAPEFERATDHLRGADLLNHFNHTIELINVLHIYERGIQESDETGGGTDQSQATSEGGDLRTSEQELGGTEAQGVDDVGGEARPGPVDEQTAPESADPAAVQERESGEAATNPPRVAADAVLEWERYEDEQGDGGGIVAYVDNGDSLWLEGGPKEWTLYVQSSEKEDLIDPQDFIGTQDEAIAKMESIVKAPSQAEANLAALDSIELTEKESSAKLGDSVTYALDGGEPETVTITDNPEVGDTDAVNSSSPIGKALLRMSAGEEKTVTLSSGERTIEVYKVAGIMEVPAPPVVLAQRVNSAQGIDRATASVTASIETPFKVDKVIDEISDIFGAEAESRVFIRDLLESVPGEKLQGLDIVYYEDSSAGAKAGEYLPRSRVIRINTANKMNTGDGVAMVFTHELGHLFAHEVLGMDFVMDQWQAMSPEQRSSAWQQYTRGTGIETKSPDSLLSSREAASEWAAMQFHRVAAEGVAGREKVVASMKREGMQPQFIDQIVNYVEKVTKLFRSWMGDAQLTTVEMEQALTEALGGTYTRKQSIKADNVRQSEFLLQKAFAAGFDTVESWMLSGSRGIKEFTAAAKEWREGERFAAPADPEVEAEPISNPALRDRVKSTNKKDIKIRTDALAPQVTGRVENGKRIVLENAAATHKELRSITFNLFKKMKDAGYEGDFESFYRDFTDTPLTPKEADAYIKNFDIELKDTDRKSMDADRKRVVDDYVVHEMYEAVAQLDVRIESSEAAATSAAKEVVKLKERLEKYQVRYNDAIVLEREAVKGLKKQLQVFKRALKARGSTAENLGRLAEIVRDLEGKRDLDNRISRKYLKGIEGLLNAPDFEIFDLLESIAESGINLNQPMKKLRLQIVEKKIVMDDVQFAAVIAIARADKQILDTMILRKLPDMKEKMAIVESEVAETNGDITRAQKATAGIRKYSALKGRIAGQRAALRGIIRSKEKIATESRAKVALMKEARAHYDIEKQKGLGRIGATTTGAIVEGVGLFNPGANASRTDLLKSIKTFKYDETSQDDVTRTLIAQKKWLQGSVAEGMKDTDPVLYNQVVTQVQRLSERTFRETVGKAGSLAGPLSRSYFDSLANSFDKTNTRAGRAIAQMLQKIESKSASLKNKAVQLGEKSDKSRAMLGRALGLTGAPKFFVALFNEQVDTPMKFYMQQDGATIEGFVKEKFPQSQFEVKALIKSYYKAEVANSTFIKNTVMEAMNEAGLGVVTNDRMQIPNYTSEEFNGLSKVEQHHRNQGTATFMMAPNYDSIGVISELKSIRGFSNVLKLIQDPETTIEAADAAINEFFSDRAAYDKLIGGLARKDKVTFFYGKDGELTERAESIHAYESSTSPANFLRSIAGGDTDAFNKNFRSLRDIYAEVYKTVQQQDEMVGKQRITGENHLGMDARKTEGWPAEWVQFRSGGATSNHLMINEVVIASVFGKNKERLEAEQRSLLKHFDGVKKKALRENDVKKAAWAGDQYSDIQGRLMRQLQEVLGSQMGPLKDMKLGMEIMGTLVQGVLNGPRAAMVQLNQLYQPLLHFGLSKTTARIMKAQFSTVAQDMFGSLFEAIGVTIKQDDQAFQTQKRLFGLDPDKINGFFEFTGDMGNNGEIGSWQARVRKLNKLVAQRGISRAQSDTALYSSFKPWAPFSQLIGGLSKAPMVAMRAEYDRMVGAAIKQAGSKGDISKIKWNAKEMGYGQLEFEKLNGILEYRVGITLKDLVARHRDNKGKGSPITDNEYRIISSLGLDLMASEANVFTTRSPQMHSPMGKFIFPLLGWAIHQPHHAAKMFKGADGEVNRRTVTAGAMTLAFGLVPAVMAMSMFEDWFDEEVMGKKRNLRPLTGDGVKGGSLAVLERVTRNGMLGMPMELVNLGVSGVGGGDMRTASLDQRVFLMNTIRSTVQLAGNVYAQKDITSQDLIRGAQLAGGNGILQQIDMFSNLLDMDHAVSRRRDRINASNYLKVGGRMVGLEMRGFSGGFRPTPITPHVSQMQLASLANDPQAFQDSYRDAIDAAKKHLGKTGPNEAEDYITRSWTSRHPLKGGFKTSPTPEDYQNILSVVGERGSEDIQEMINNYNRFGSMIGATPFAGKVARGKKSQFASFSSTGLGF